MSAPTPAPGDDRPREGYYPDPSIPGYVRYWNGAAWVPGTSRPAPSDGEPLPAPPGTGRGTGAPVTPPAVEETGPHFFDEDPLAAGQEQHGVRPEPASAWQADANRQSGLGGEQERRISWGAQGQADPRVPSDGTPAAGPAAAPEPPEDESNPGTVMIRAVKPGASKPTAGEGTVTFRRPTGPVKPADGAATGAPAPTPTPAPVADGTMTIRAVRSASGQQQGAQTATPQPAPQPAVPAQASVPPQAPAPAQAPAPQPQPVQQPQPGAATPQPTVPQQGGAPAPVTSGPGGGSQSWAQQVHQLAGAAPAAGQGDGQPVVPWKPVADDPFLAAARAQASARPAGLGRRLAARLVDTVALAAVTGAAALPLGAEAADHVDSKIDAAKLSGEKTTVWLLDGTTAGYLGIILAVLLLFGVVYEALPTAKWGRTLGKKVCGIEVRDIEEHEPPTFAAALRRWLVYSVPGLLVIGVVGVLWCLFDKPWRQCWHDKAANTFVAG
ncbi:RDD family protein [Streptomyces sp. NPDC006627]|uniref:RDD family protein n=1 Tax=Streptomyces sp. NPDC006627 TaxID=3154679 RepID=UPI0033A0D0F8